MKNLNQHTLNIGTISNLKVKHKNVLNPYRLNPNNKG